LPGAIAASLSEWQEPIASATDARRRLGVAFPKIEARLQATDDGALLAYEATGQTIEKDGILDADVGVASMGRVAGTSFLGHQRRLDAHLDDLIRAMKHVVRTLGTGNHVPQQELVRLRKTVGAAQSKEIAKQYDEARKLFSPASFAQVAPWATKEGLGHGRVCYQNGTLADDMMQSFTLPNLSPLSTRPVDLLLEVAGLER
jgi:hypothetical protein